MDISALQKWTENNSAKSEFKLRYLQLLQQCYVKSAEGWKENVGKEPKKQYVIDF